MNKYKRQKTVLEIPTISNKDPELSALIKELKESDIREAREREERINQVLLNVRLDQD